jgi:pyrroline-5-carboxylate reductase
MRLAEPDANLVAFIGGGNMAQALLGGLLRSGRRAEDLLVVEPLAAQRERLAAQLGVKPLERADARLAKAATVVWAVKPQQFGEAAAPCAAHVASALQLSVMAGIRTAAIAGVLGIDPLHARIVRAMPNTPALIGRGIAGLYATPAVDRAGRDAVQAMLAPTGATLWLAAEEDLDAVTALSGSGPAYVFFVLEAMIQAGAEMGLSAADRRALAVATFDGAAELARRSELAPEALRAQVTSKGGTTHAAITVLEAAGVKEAFVRALLAARQRARELGDEFGTSASTG